MEEMLVCNLQVPELMEEMLVGDLLDNEIKIIIDDETKTVLDSGITVNYQFQATLPMTSLATVFPDFESADIIEFMNNFSNDLNNWIVNPPVLLEEILVQENLIQEIPFQQMYPMMIIWMLFWMRFK